MRGRIAGAGAQYLNLTPLLVVGRAFFSLEATAGSSTDLESSLDAAFVSWSLNPMGVDPRNMHFSITAAG